MIMRFLKSIQRSSRLAVASLIILVSACTGGAAIVASGGIGGTGMSLGPILLIGSVTVNKVKYETTNADIYIEDTLIGTGDQFVFDNLAIGQVVRVEGTNNGDGTGDATAVYFNDNVEGPILTRTDIDANTIELSVMGQPVIVDSETNILDINNNPLILSDLQEDNVVQISGLIDQNGTIRATFARKKADNYSTSEIYDLKGIVTSLAGNDSSGDFMINNLQINYDSNTNLSDPGLIAIGGMSNSENHLVEVKGTFDGTSLSATRIQIETELNAEDDEEVELQGYVTTTGTNQFTLGYQLVQYNSGTQFKDGLASDIAIGVHLEVEGVFQNGVLMAEEIEFEDQAEVTSAVETYSSGSNSLLLNLKGLTGVNVYINSVADIDGTANNLTELEGLVTTSPDVIRIKARGQWDGNKLLARDVEVGTTGSSQIDARLQGPVTAKSQPVLTVMDEMIDTSGMSYEANDNNVSQTQFFNAIHSGDIVKLEGTLTTAGSGSIDWDQIELEGD